MSNQNLILDPILFERYHCAILSAEQNQGIGHFSLDQVKQFLDIEANEWGDICHRLTSFWGDFNRVVDGFEIHCRLSSDNQTTLYLIFDWNFERLETRVTRLGYLLNQRAVLVLPKEGGKLRSYLLNGNGLVFSPQYKERDQNTIYDAIHYYFRYIYQRNIHTFIEYKENRQFINAGIMSKNCMHLLGQRADKRLAKIEIGHYFEIKEEN